MEHPLPHPETAASGRRGSKRQRGSPENGKESSRRQRILLAAESLFARHSYEGVSIRDIAKRARVNSALVGYHFGSKSKLYAAIFEARYAPLTVERMSGIRAALEQPDTGSKLEALVRALIEPYVALKDQPGGRSFATLLAREVADPLEAKRGIIARIADPTARRVMDGMRSVFPQASEADIGWAYLFTVGAATLTVADQGRIDRLSNNQCRAADVRGALRRLIPYVCAGLVAVLKP